tara:strand:- start:2694 stop:3374 length:681 start_codon:yes stop_codon:yes gene_type:complete
MIARISARQVVKATIAIVLIAFTVAWFLGPISDLLSNFDGDTISGWTKAAGLWGPFLIITLMTVAVVATPIPSAPIALAAGAAYGHILGTVYIVLGAELGAIIAFTLARFLGRDVLVRWLGEKIDRGWLGSQNALTAAAFVSRLMPFISFDIVSYAAGLSTLHFWRFALATLAGVMPVSFVLAHFGNEAASGPPTLATWIAIGLGALTLTPLLIVAIAEQRKNRPG